MREPHDDDDASGHALLAGGVIAALGMLGVLGAALGPRLLRTAGVVDLEALGLTGFLMLAVGTTVILFSRPVD